MPAVWLVPDCDDDALGWGNDGFHLDHMYRSSLVPEPVIDLFFKGTGLMVRENPDPHHVLALGGFPAIGPVVQEILGVTDEGLHANRVVVSF